MANQAITEGHAIKPDMLNARQQLDQLWKRQPREPSASAQLPGVLAEATAAFGQIRDEFVDAGRANVDLVKQQWLYDPLPRAACQGRTDPVRTVL